jgi:ABC-type sugar transport system ATPase subunit
MADVRFEQATKLYPGRDVPAVDALDLHIQDGEFMVLVGPSGSGKTTALRMLAGLEEVDDGFVLIGGRDVTDLPPKSRDVAMVFQNYALYPYLTVEANIAFPLLGERGLEGVLECASPASIPVFLGDSPELPRTRLVFGHVASLVVLNRSYDDREYAAAICATAAMLPLRSYSRAAASKSPTASRARAFTSG